MELIDRVLLARNLTLASKQVISNKGSAGVDGMSVKELKAWLDTNRTMLEEMVREGRYYPQPIRGKELSAAISRIP